VVDGRQLPAQAARATSRWVEPLKPEDSSSRAASTWMEINCSEQTLPVDVS